jgi:hypothetical protein
MAENQKTDAKAPAAPANGLKSPTKPAKSKAARVAFADLVVLYERALKTSKHEKKKELLTTFFSKWEGEEYFHLMRLLLPQLDKERQTYGLKETMLAKSYIHLLNISPTSEDALRLLHWRRPAKGVTGEIVRQTRTSIMSYYAESLSLFILSLRVNRRVAILVVLCISHLRIGAAKKATVVSLTSTITWMR